MNPTLLMAKIFDPPSAALGTWNMRTSFPFAIFLSRVGAYRSQYRRREPRGEELVANKQQMCGRYVLVVLPDFFYGQVYLVAGDGARCDVLSTLTCLFDLEDLPFRWPPSRIPGDQSTRVRVPSWLCSILALVLLRRLAPTPTFALVWASLRRRVNFTFACPIVASLQVCVCLLVAAP